MPCGVIIYNDANGGVIFQKDCFLQVVWKGLKTAGYSDRNCFQICYLSRLQKRVILTLLDYINSFLNRNKPKKVATGKYMQI